MSDSFDDVDWEDESALSTAERNAATAAGVLRNSGSQPTGLVSSVVEHPTSNPPISTQQQQQQQQSSHDDEISVEIARSSQAVCGVQWSLDKAKVLVEVARGMLRSTEQLISLGALLEKEVKYMIEK